MLDKILTSLETDLRSPPPYSDRLICLLVINTYCGANSRGNIIFTKEHKEDVWLTLNIIRLTCCLKCFVKPIQAGGGSPVYSGLDSQSHGKCTSCICMLVLIPGPRPQKHL